MIKVSIKRRDGWLGFNDILSTHIAAIIMPEIV